MPPSEAPREEVLRDALRESRWSLALVAILFIGSASALISLVVAYERGLLIREDQVVAEAREHLTRHADEIFLEAGDFVSEAMPPVGDALYEQLEEDLPLYVRAVDRQSEALVEHLAQSLRKKLRSQMRDYLARHRAVFREEFPEIKEKNILAQLEADFQRAFDRLMDRYYVDQFQAESRRLVKAWRAIPPAARPSAGQPRLTQRLLADLGEWAEMELLADVEVARQASTKEGSKRGN